MGRRILGLVSGVKYDPEMTGYAFGVHEKLIKSGIAPDTQRVL